MIVIYLLNLVCFIQTVGYHTSYGYGKDVHYSILNSQAYSAYFIKTLINKLTIYNNMHQFMNQNSLWVKNYLNTYHILIPFICTYVTISCAHVINKANTICLFILKTLYILYLFIKSD